VEKEFGTTNCTKIQTESSIERGPKKGTLATYDQYAAKVSPDENYTDNIIGPISIAPEANLLPFAHQTPP